MNKNILHTVWRDINDRKAIEIALRNSEEKYRNIFELSPEAIALIDINGKIIDLNNRIEDWLGFKPSEVKSKKLIDLELIKSDNIGTLISNFNKIVTTKDVVTFELEFLDSESRIKNGLITASPILNVSGEISFVLAMISNITERKNAELQILEMNKKLEEKVEIRTIELRSALKSLEEENNVRRKTEEELTIAKEEISKALEREKDLSELKSRFISMISHEYRTPLTVILTSTYIIEQLYSGVKKFEFMKYIGKIRNSVETMTQLHENVLLIGKSDLGRLILSIVEIDIIEQIHNIIEEIRFIDENQHPIEFISPLNIFHYKTDVKLFRQIFTNILSNACKYSGVSKPIRVELQFNTKDLKIIISDKGIGIIEEDQNYIFESFHRGKNIGAISGTGLGLAIVKKSVEALNGNIEVKSKIMDGTSFFVSFPI